MKKYRFFFIFFILSFILGTSAFADKSEIQFPSKKYHRIVSLLPSITEMLFALDLGNDVVGVTQYCQYPPEAKSKTIVGNLMDINYEVVYRIRPDLIILSAEYADQREKFKQMGIDILDIDTRSVKSILESIQKIGDMLNRKTQANELIETIQNKITLIRQKTKDLPKPRVLVTFLRPVGEGEIHDVYVAGNFTYFSDLLEILGAQNAYQGSKLVTSPILSAEGILRLDPDIIVETMSSLPQSKLTSQDALKDWDMLSSLKAYKNKKIYILTGSYVEVPGPRIVNLLDDMARAIQPQINWDTDVATSH